MKSALPILALLLFLIQSCKKEAEDTTIPPEPRGYTYIKDTITSGQWQTFKIGSTSEEIYASIQTFQANRNDDYLGITQNIYDQIEPLENKIPLYHQILFDHAIGSQYGIQINFENDKVKSIYTNNGQKLNKWPEVVTQASKSISPGDPITGIYQKLVEIKKMHSFDPLLERLSLGAKNIKKAYDPAMTNSPQWYLVTSVNTQKFLVTFNFTAGILTTINADEMIPL